MNHLNVEIKAYCSDPQKVRDILIEKSAEYKGLDHQIDTYFKIETGKLKVREGNIENGLIHYEREESAGFKESRVQRIETTAGSTLKDILSKVLEVLVVVDKRREIYFIGNVKFHIDDVNELGTFVEIEAIDEKGSLGKEFLTKQCQEFSELLGITNENLVAQSYSDMLLLKHG